MPVFKWHSQTPIRSEIMTSVLRRLVPVIIMFLILTTTLLQQSVWWDEGISLHLASSSWSEIVKNRATNIHPPLYFFLLKLWTSVVGSSIFAARYLSVLAATLLPAAVFSFLKDRFDNRSAITASFLISLAPPFIVYGQEVRAYAFLPLFYIILLSQIWDKKNGKGFLSTITPRWRGILLGLTQILFVEFHYTGLFAVALVDLYLLIRSVLHKSLVDKQMLGVSLLACLVFSTPWLAVVFYFGFGGIIQQAGISNPFSDPVPLDYLVKLLAVFNVTGLPKTLSAVQITRPAVLTGVFTIIILILRLLHKNRQRIIALLGIWLLPFLFCPVIWLISPQSHPRYLFPYYIGGWIVVGVLSQQVVIIKRLRMMLVAALLVTSVSSLVLYLYDERYARSDIKSAAAFLKDKAFPGDVVIIPYTDWSLPQYDTGSVDIFMLPAPGIEYELANYLSTHPDLENVYLLDYERGVLDQNEYVRFMLTRQGYLRERITYHNVVIEHYAIQTTFRPVACTPLPQMCVESEGLCLTGADIPENGVSGAMLPVSLCWKNSRLSQRYVLAFRLYDEAGILVNSRNALLLSSDNKPSEMWDANAFSRTYHRVPLTLGLVPESYRLELSIYVEGHPDTVISFTGQDGKRIPAVFLGAVKPSLSEWVDSSPELIAPDVNPITKYVTGGLSLSGFRLDPDVLTPGSNVYITLLWQVRSGNLGVFTPEIHLIQEGVELSRLTTWHQFSSVPPGRPLLDHQTMTIPPNVKSGLVDVLLTINEQRLTFLLGKIQVNAVNHVFAEPEYRYPIKENVPGIANLTGFTLTPQDSIAQGVPFTVTLVWQAEQDVSNQDLKVFVQLIDVENGVGIVAQHDAKPVNWTRPTTGWVDGEYLIDDHRLQWLRSGSGKAALFVGLYDADSGIRLRWANGEDALKLSERITYQISD